MATDFITDREIYSRVILDLVPKTDAFLWIGTSDMKDLYVEKRRKMVPFLEVLSDLVARKVSIRIIHAKEPGRAYRRDFDRYPLLAEGIERIVCPRVHFKSLVSDGRYAYTGSANLTGAGMGAKSEDRRNFEAGFITDDPDLVSSIMAQFDAIWMGSHCGTCQRKQFCRDYSLILQD